MHSVCGNQDAKTIMSYLQDSEKYIAKHLVSGEHILIPQDEVHFHE